MGETANIGILEGIIDTFDSSSGSLMIRQYWGQISEAYMQNLGSPQHADLVTKIHDKVKELAGSGIANKFITFYQNTIKKGYDEIRNNPQIPGVWSVADKLAANPNDAQAQIKQDFEDGKRRLIYEIIKEGCKNVSISVDSLDKISKDKEGEAVKKLAGLYAPFRTSLTHKSRLLDISDAKVDKATGINSSFDEKKQSVDGLVAKYKDDIKAYETQKREYPGKIKEHKANPKKEKPKTPTFEYKQHLQEVNGLLKELKGLDQDNVKKTEDMLRIKGLVREYDEYIKRLENHIDNVEADRDIEVFVGKKNVGEKQIATYEKAKSHDNAPEDLDTIHVTDLSKGVLIWFIECRDSIVKAERVKKRRGLVKEFDEYHARLKTHIEKVEEEGSKGEDTLTLEAKNIRCYEIGNVTEKIDDPELKGKVKEYTRLIFCGFNPREQKAEHYEGVLAKLNEIRNYFATRKQNAEPDTAKTLETCIETMDAFSIRVRANQFRKVTFNEDQGTAKSNIEKLALEAEKYKQDSDLYQNLPELDAHLYRLVDFVEDTRRWISNKHAGTGTEGAEPEDPWTMQEVNPEPAERKTPKETPKADEAEEPTLSKEYPSGMLNYNEAIDELQIGDCEMQDIIAKGELRAFRAGGTMKFREVDIAGLKKERTSEPEAAAPNAPAVVLGGGGVSGTEEIVFEDSDLTILPLDGDLAAAEAPASSAPPPSQRETEPQPVDVGTVVAEAQSEFEALTTQNPDPATFAAGMEKFIKKLEGAGVDCTQHRTYLTNFKSQSGL